MGRIRKLHMGLALALLAMMTAGPIIAQVKDQPKEKRPTLLTAEPIKADPKDDELKKLLIARYNAAVEVTAMHMQNAQVGQASFGSLFESSQRVLQSGLELQEKPTDRVALLSQYLELAQFVEELADARTKAGLGSKTDLAQARYFRIDAEIQLFRAKRAAEKPKEK